MPMTTEVLRTTCPRDCYDSCGIVVVKRDGHVSQVRGDPEHPVSRGKLCEKCSAGYNREWRDPRVRLTRPLRRVGRKGEGRFEAVSWDVALTTIADRFGSIVSTPGPQTILNVHYTGTISLIAFLFPLRFFNRLGATEVTPDTICNMAGQVALSYVYGTGLVGFDPRTVRDAATIMIWGANPSASAPHTQEHWVAKAPGRVIVVDPVRTATAAAADLHLQPYPGTDAALAFALLHVLRRDGLVDRRFVAAHTVGWGELEALLNDCTPSWGEAATSVPALLIEEAAHLYGAGPSLLWLGQALQRQARGGNVIRACAMLPAVTGNVGKRGAGFLYLNWDLNLAERFLNDAYLTAGHMAASPVPRISHMDLAACLEDPARARGLVCWNMNIAASSPEQARLRRALSREDLFTVVLDLFPTDTTDFADFVLPAASFLEFDDLIAGYFQLALSAQVKAMEPLGEALPNQEIFRRLARAMGYSEPELYEADASIISTLLQNSRLGLDFPALAARGTVPVTSEPLITFADLTFPTPSGRVEIASARAEADGHPRVPLPLAEPRPTNSRLRLLSPASSWRCNSSFGNVSKMNTREPSATVVLHPADAADRWLCDGDYAVLANETGRLTMRVRVSDTVPRGVALTHKGRWPKQEQDQVNVNWLNPGHKADMGESTCVHGVEVTAVPVRDDGRGLTSR
jgi:anaerobic selenocysteine-containing dehydrogenase